MDILTKELVSIESDVLQHPPKGRFLNNIIANFISFGLGVMINLWFTPYLIKHLGVSAFGLIPLATTVTNYLVMFTTALNGAVGRFLTIAVEQNDKEAANRIFNTSLFGSTGIILILVLPGIWLSRHVNWFFNVPEGYTEQFIWLFLFTLAVFFLTTLGSAFSLASFCRNRFDLSNIVGIANSIVRLVVVIILFSMFVPAVWHVGLGMLAAATIGLIGSIIIWRYLLPSLSINPAFFDVTTLGKLTGTGGWMVVGSIGTILYLGIDIVVVNKLLGAEAGGQYGALMQWSALLRTIAGVVASVFAPTIIAFYAHKDIPGLIRYSRQAVKFLGLVIALPIGLICGLSGSILQIWLGPKFSMFAPLLSLMTIHLAVNLGVLPLFNIQQATNNVRIPGIVTLVTGGMNIGLALLLAGPVGWGMYGVAAAGAVMLTMKNLVFTPLYAAHILGIKRSVFFHETIPIIGTTVGIAMIGFGITHLYAINSWFKLIAVGGVITILYLVFLYFIILSKEEKLMAQRMVAKQS